MARAFLVLAELERHADELGDQVEFLDEGTQGLALLDRIASRSAAVEAARGELEGASYKT